VFFRHNLFKGELLDFSMKLMTLMFVGMFVLALGFVSAESYVYGDEDVVCVVGDDSLSCEEIVPKADSFSTSCIGCDDRTMIIGKTYDQDSGDPIVGANIEVICDQDGTLTTKYTQSLANGFYVVKFEAEECTIGDFVVVNAEKDGLVGHEGPREVEDRCMYDWIVLCICVPMVPEFGVVVGMLTALSAVGIFFVVRKE
jgi:hypothetical protein